MPTFNTLQMTHSTRHRPHSRVMPPATIPSNNYERVSRGKEGFRLSRNGSLPFRTRTLRETARHHTPCVPTSLIAPTISKEPSGPRVSQPQAIAKIKKQAAAEDYKPHRLSLNEKRKTTIKLPRAACESTPRSCSVGRSVASCRKTCCPMTPECS